MRIAIKQKTAICHLALFLFVPMLASLDAHAFYNPSTGKWLTRDPVMEKSGPDLYGFCSNSPVQLVDPLGQVACGAFMQANCRQPCEDFKRIRYADMPESDVDNGVVICCGGVKYICTYGVDREKNTRAKEIVRKCLHAHERVHLAGAQCPACECGPSAMKDRPRSDYREEEVRAYGAGRECFEAAKSECGTDEECLRHVQSWADHEATQQQQAIKECNPSRKR